MLALGIDTSSGAGSVGLMAEEGLSGELNLACPRTHSERLLPSIHALLEAARLRLDQVDLIAVSAGPGSFTGLRIGMATAKGLALAIGRPVVGFSTLETTALACAPALQAEGGAWPWPVCVMLDAGRGEVYHGLFRCEGGEAVALRAERATEPAGALERLPDPCLVCGDGAVAYKDLVVSALVGRGLVMETAPPIGATLARRALHLVSRRGLAGLPPLVPNYLRLADAERTFKP